MRKNPFRLVWQALSARLRPSSSQRGSDDATEMVTLARELRAKGYEVRFTQVPLRLVVTVSNVPPTWFASQEAGR